MASDNNDGCRECERSRPAVALVVDLPHGQAGPAAGNHGSAWGEGRAYPRFFKLPWAKCQCVFVKVHFLIIKWHCLGQRICMLNNGADYSILKSAAEAGRG
jgi:hypothetical protein